MELNSSFEIMIVFDDICSKPGFIRGFGFSALIYNHFTENYSLFDTGGNGDALVHNIERFDVKISEIKKVIISHKHFDHSGGLNQILKSNKNVEIYVPENTLDFFMKKYDVKSFYGIGTFTEIEKNMYASGQLTGGSIPEEALFLKDKNNELIILVGCAHPGLEKFILLAQNYGKIRAIIGGFHGFQKLTYLEEIEFIGACHCTKHLNSIKGRFPEQYKRVCLGDVFTF